MHHLISSRLVSSRLVSSRLISFRRLSPTGKRTKATAQWSARTSCPILSVFMGGRVCVGLNSVLCVLCVCFVHPVPSAAYFVASLFSSLLPGFLPDHRNLGKRPACKKQPKMEVQTSLGHTASSFLGAPASAASTSWLRVLLLRRRLFFSGCPMVRDASPLPSWRGL